MSGELHVLGVTGGGGSAASLTPGVFFGDGSDGAHVCVDGEEIASGQYTDFTIPAGVTVTVAPPDTTYGVTVIACTGTYTINGTVDLRGASAVDRQGAGGASAGGQTNGVIGAQFHGAVVGGAGGEGAAGTAVGNSYLAPSHVWANPVTQLARATPTGWAGLPGGGAGGDGTNYGGGGGGGGGFFLIAARHVAHGPDNLYLLKGGDGAPGGDDGTGTTGHGTCGGGGGGGNGWWMTVSDDIAGSAAIDNTVGGGGIRSGPLATLASVTAANAPTLPLTVVAGSNDEFLADVNGGVTPFVVAPGVYATVGALAGAVNQSTDAPDEPLGAYTVGFSVNAGKLVYSESQVGAVGDGSALHNGTHNILAALGFTDGQALTGEVVGSTDGAPGAPGFAIHYTPTGSIVQT